MELGAQMFTVHDYTKDLKSFEESLKRIAEIGYTCVQVSGTCDYNPKWLKDKLEKYGLKCVITHTAPDKLINATEYVIEDHNVFDCKYIGLGGMPAIWNPDYTIHQALDSFKKDFLEPAKKIKDGGKYFMYHNHDYEFVKLQDGRTLYDAMIEDVPADVVEKEKEILSVQARNEGKPENIIEKMVMGRINKFYKENCLIEQEFVKDPDLTIKKLLAAKGKEIGSDIAVKDYVRFEKGDGLEKREDDFAAEVASMMNK